MKNCIVALSVLVSSFVLGQEQPVREVKLTKLKPAQVNNSPSGDPSKIQDSLAGMTIEHCEYVIQAIDHKVEYVKSDQTEHEKALASGWYDRMAINRAAWVADRDELLRRKNNSK